MKCAAERRKSWLVSRLDKGFFVRRWLRLGLVICRPKENQGRRSGRMGKLRRQTVEHVTAYVDAGAAQRSRECSRFESDRHLVAALGPVVFDHSLQPAGAYRVAKIVTHWCDHRWELVDRLALCEL